jgi:hypothetical protein
VSAPSAEQIRTVVESHVELWNAREKEAWLAHWKNVVPGEVTMEDPVGTPLKRGWEIQSEAWDRANADWTLGIALLHVCGSTAAAVIRNTGNVDGEPVTVESIEIYAFADNGSLHTSTFWPLSIGNEYAQWTSETGEA